MLATFQTPQANRQSFAPLQAPTALPCERHGQPLGSIGKLVLPAAKPHEARPLAGKMAAPACPASQGPFGAIESIVSMLHEQPPVGGENALETLRMQMFGRYYEELEGRMKELRVVVDGGMARNRRALMERVEELGSALHRDMVALRQETHQELEDLKRDVFSAVMNLSALNDRLGMADSRIRETWTALAKALADHISQQAGNFQATIQAFQGRVEATISDRVNREVTAALTGPLAPARM